MKDLTHYSLKVNLDSISQESVVQGASQRRGLAPDSVLDSGNVGWQLSYDFLTVEHMKFSQSSCLCIVAKAGTFSSEAIRLMGLSL